MDGNVTSTLAECTGVKNKYPRNNHTLEVLWVSTWKVQTGRTWNFTNKTNTGWKETGATWASGRSGGGMRWPLRSFPPQISLEFWDLRAEKSGPFVSPEKYNNNIISQISLQQWRSRTREIPPAGWEL